MSLNVMDQIFSITDFRTDTKKIMEALSRHHAIIVMKGSKKLGIFIDEEMAQKYQEMEEKLEYQSILISKLKNQLNPQNVAFEDFKEELLQLKKY